MEYKEKLEYFAGAPKADAAQCFDKQFKPFWIGRLRGCNVTMDSSAKHRRRVDAVNDARAFRQSCKNELSALAKATGGEG